MWNIKHWFFYKSYCDQANKTIKSKTARITVLCMHFSTCYLCQFTKQAVCIKSTQKVMSQSTYTLYALHHTFHNYVHCMCMPGRSNTCEHARIISASMIDTEAILQLWITPWISCPALRIFPIKGTGLRNCILIYRIGLAKIIKPFH